MAEKAKDAPVEESKETKPVETKTEPAKAEKEVKVGDALDTKGKAKDEPKMVPEAVLIEYKKENKEMFKELKELKALIESGATRKEVSTDLKAIAEKHNVDADFVKEFAEAVRKEAEADFESKMKPAKDAEIAAKRDKLFEEHYGKAIEANPEYKSLANKEVIKTLALDPRNADKTFAQIIEGAYGHLVTGRKTLDTTKARGGKDDVEIDFNKAQSNTEYFKEIMADPELKKKYNAGLAERVKF